MITEYHRPATLEAAMDLMKGFHGKLVPLAGGTILKRKEEAPFAVMDLQDLPIRTIEKHGNELHIGAGVTLQQMVDDETVPVVLRRACQEEASYNLRQVGTIGGCVAGAGGRSTLLGLLLAMNARLELLPGNEKATIGSILPLRADLLAGKLITTVVIDLTCKAAYHRICKTPMDQPLVGVSVARWSSGRTRASVFGFGDVPCLAMDGPTQEGLSNAVQNACAGAVDIHADAEYRMAMAGILSKRCLEAIGEEA
jgi:putative selenate reductase FAD-binding subunit